MEQGQEAAAKDLTKESTASLLFRGLTGSGLGAAWNQLARVCYTCSAEHGFWDALPRNKGEMIALMHSELSEMLEGIRKPGADSHCPEFSNEAIEAADLLIRLADYCYGHGIDLIPAVKAKIAYNLSRPHKHGKAF